MIEVPYPGQESQDETPRLSAVDSRAGEKIPDNPAVSRSSQAPHAESVPPQLVA